MSPKEKEAAKQTETETPKPAKKPPTGQALSDQPSTEKDAKTATSITTEKTPDGSLTRAGTQLRRNKFGN